MTSQLPEGTPDLLAYVGEDEHGSGQIGLKQARVPAGIIPIVAVDRHRGKITRPELVAQLQAQANHYGQTITLVRYQPVEVLLEVKPT